jgi:hypothetical protein
MANSPVNNLKKSGLSGPFQLNLDALKFKQQSSSIIQKNEDFQVLLTPLENIST